MDESYIELCAAIIKQAMLDYKEALREDRRKDIEECERFFLGAWGQLLSEYHGEYIIEQCKKEVAKKTRKE